MKKRNQNIIEMKIEVEIEKIIINVKIVAVEVEVIKRSQVLNLRNIKIMNEMAVDIIKQKTVIKKKE
jgi:hypothetical protein